MLSGAKVSQGVSLVEHDGWETGRHLTIQADLDMSLNGENECA